MKNSDHSSHLYDEFAQRFKKKSFVCYRTSENEYEKFERIHNFCIKHGLILNSSTINTIQQSFSNIITTAFDYNIEENQKITDIKLQLTYVNALPTRTEQGIFLTIELGNSIEDIRYSLVLLLGKQIPSYEILHSRGYNLDEQIRFSNGKLLLDHLAIGLKDFLEQISSNIALPQPLQVGLLVHFPIKQKELDHAEIISWSDRFNCPDLLKHNFLRLFDQSIKKYIFNYAINLIACIAENVAALISVAFEYPNTYLSLIFKNKFQLSFIEDSQYLHKKNLLQHPSIHTFDKTILSFNFQSLHSKDSRKSHALFQTLLTSVDIYVMSLLNVNYFDILTCDLCLTEILRLLIIELCIHEEFLPKNVWLKSKLIQPKSLSIQFIHYLLQGKYSKLKSSLNNLGLNPIKKFHLISIEYLCHIIIRRSTQILSCLIVSLSNRSNKENLTIAIDSNLYHLCPIYQIYLQNDIEYLCKRWITTFHFVNATNKIYLGLTAVMSLQKTQKAVINQDDNISRLRVRDKRYQRSQSTKVSR